MHEIAAVLITLHTASGTTVVVNSDLITHLRNREPTRQGDQVFTKEVNCMINMADGKYVTVIETCDEVRKAMGQK